MAIRSCQLWRNEDGSVYAEDSNSGERFPFSDFVGAAAANDAARSILAEELQRNLTNFGKWLLGQETGPVPFVNPYFIDGTATEDPNS